MRELSLRISISLYVVMYLTLQDVLSHPAYKRYVLSKSCAEIQRMPDILLFIDLCDVVKSLVKRHGLTEQVSGDHNPRYPRFKHYKEYAWSKPGCPDGPHICVCSNVSFHCYRIIDILKTLTADEEEEEMNQ